MDKVVEQLFTRLGERDEAEGRRSLIVLVGDHGMTELGNHGGSSDGEVSAVSSEHAPLQLSIPCQVLMISPRVHCRHSFSPRQPYRHALSARRRHTTAPIAFTRSCSRLTSCLH